MPRVIHFEIAADDPERAAAFYRAAFGWQTEKWAGPIPYWLVMTGAPDQPGIDGGITLRQPDWPGVVNTLDVDNLDEAVARVVAAGGSVVEARMVVPGVGYMAYCRDTEGNAFGLMQSDMTAA